MRFVYLEGINAILERGGECCEHRLFKQSKLSSETRSIGYVGREKNKTRVKHEKSDLQ